MTDIKRHNWTESEEKSLVSNVKWVEENVTKEAIKKKGKWNIVSSLLSSDISISVTSNACRKRVYNINKREQEVASNGRKTINLLGTDFPQEVQQTAEEKLQGRVAVLERKVDNLINSLNQLSELNIKVTGLVEAIKKGHTTLSTLYPSRHGLAYRG